MAPGSKGAPKALVVGCSGPRLTAEERDLFRSADPLGFILFAHNCEDPDQVRALTAELRDTVGRADAPILIDQEGGRVARLKPPHWRAAPAPAVFAAMEPAKAGEAARLNARLLAHELLDLGITVDCAPVLDIPQADADPIIGDRAAGTTPEQAMRLGSAACVGFLMGGVAPVIKHIPGHGRATADSHKELPVVKASLDELRAVDFAPFKALGDAPWAMTAHVVYQAIDPDRPATTSKKVIDDIIRMEIGLQSFLVSDDLAMEALDGTLPERAEAVLAAGCDAVLYCNTQMRPLEEVAAVADACAPLTEEAQARFRRAEDLRGEPEPFDSEAGKARLEALLGEAS